MPSRLLCPGPVRRREFLRCALMGIASLSDPDLLKKHQIRLPIYIGVTGPEKWIGPSSPAAGVLEIVEDHAGDTFRAV